MWFTESSLPGVGLSLEVARVLHDARSAHQSVAVYETPTYGNVLVLDGLIQTTERDEFVYHEMIAHVPLLSHPAPRDVLVVGGGDGGTVREVLRHPGVRRVDLCEIDGDVIRLCRAHLPGLASSLDDPRVTVHVADALAFVRAATARWDVVIVDSSDPVGPGEGLFSTAFYSDVRRALRPDGVVVAQSESPFAMVDGFQRTLRALGGAFPVVRPYLAAVPTYPGGLWSWSFAAVDREPTLARPADAARLSAETRYYNPELHEAAFVLPNHVRRAVAEAR